MKIIHKDPEGPHGFPESIKVQKQDGSVARYSFNGICERPDDPHDNMMPKREKG